MFYQKKSCKKAGAIKRFVYSPCGSELKKQTDISKNNINIYARFLSLIKRVILNIWETKVKMKKKNRLYLTNYDSRFNFNKYVNNVMIH